MGYNSRRPHWVPLISSTNRKRGCNLQELTIGRDWKNVAWSDESRFLLRHSDGRVRIWHKQHQNMDYALLCHWIMPLLCHSDYAIMPCYHCAGWWWCNGVGEVFLAHFRPLSDNWVSFKMSQPT